MAAQRVPGCRDKGRAAGAHAGRHTGHPGASARGVGWGLGAGSACVHTAGLAGVVEGLADQRQVMTCEGLIHADSMHNVYDLCSLLLATTAGTPATCGTWAHGPHQLAQAVRVAPSHSATLPPLPLGPHNNLLRCPTCTACTAPAARPSGGPWTCGRWRAAAPTRQTCARTSTPPAWRTPPTGPRWRCWSR